MQTYYIPCINNSRKILETGNNIFEIIQILGRALL